jgi:hypothetical protein
MLPGWFSRVIHVAANRRVADHLKGSRAAEEPAAREPPTRLRV